MDEISLLPIAKWQFGVIASMNAITFCPHFLSHALQHLEEAQHDRTFVMSLAMALVLRDDLDQAIAQLQRSAAAGTGLPKH